ncbi:hypothetical protein MP228_005223 [Amoeboaphelidium protococcarum]|nr:hypothetical protein MP228_005223 [Amoeboaphelidium protococcarum]
MAQTDLQLAQVLQQKLNVLEQEKSELKRAVGDCREELLAARQYVYQLESGNQQLQEEVTTLKSNLNSLQQYAADASHHRESLQKLQKDNRLQKQQIKQLLQENKDLQLAYKGTIGELGQVDDDLKQYSKLSDEHQSLKIYYAEALEELSIVQRERDMLQSAFNTLEDRVVELENDKADNLVVVEEAKRIVRENQIINTSSDGQQSAREAELLEDISRLNHRLQSVKDGVKLQIEQEVSMLTDDHNKKQRKLFDEITDLQIESANLKSQLALVSKDNLLLKLELEQVVKSSQSAMERKSNQLEDLNNKSRKLASERDQSVHQLETLRQQMSRRESKFESDKQLLQQGSEIKSSRIRQLEQENESMKSELIQHVKLLNERKSEVEQLIASKEAVIVSNDNKMKAIKQQHSQSIEKYHQELSSLKMENQQLKKEVQTLLFEQQKTTQLWRNEIEDIKRQHQLKVGRLNDERADLVKQISELECQIAELTSIKDSVSAQLSISRQNQEKLTLMVESSDAQIDLMSVQIKEFLQREHDLIEKKHELERAVDRLTLEKKRQVQNESKQRLLRSLNIRSSKLSDKSGLSSQSGSSSLQSLQQYIDHNAAGEDRENMPNLPQSESDLVIDAL